MCKHGLHPKVRLENGSIPVPHSGCWIWLGTIMSQGYGSIKYEGQMWQAHRLSWLAFNGEHPGKLSVLHKCDVRACVNPDHLFLGNHKINSDDMWAKGRASRRDGIFNGRAKVSPEQVILIRSSHLSCQKLADQFGMSKSTIARIKRRKYWSNIEAKR